MASHWFLVLLVLSTVCLALTQISYDDCCLKYVRRLKPSTHKHAVGYREQKVDGGCNIPAVIFTMKRGRRFCMDPSEKWVKELMKKTDKRRERSKGRKVRPQPQQNTAGSS